MPFVTYLLNPDQHTNQFETYPGIGETKEESRLNSKYYPNQIPWVRTVAESKAPWWARREARTTRENELKSICDYGYDCDGNPRSPTNSEIREYEEIRVQRF